MEPDDLNEIINAMNTWKDQRISTAGRAIMECTREDISLNRTRARGIMEELYNDLKIYANVLMAISMTGIDPRTNLGDMSANGDTGIGSLLWGNDNE
jgi:hypothetical protein